METAEQREAAFNADLTALLKKYGAELTVSDDGKEYGMHSGICTIVMDSVYNNETDVLEKEWCEFLLDTYLP